MTKLLGLDGVENYKKINNKIWLVVCIHIKHRTKTYLGGQRSPIAYHNHPPTY